MKPDKIFPPKWAFQLLRCICPDHLFEEIEGDLVQKFQRDVKTFGERKAKRRFVWNTMRFFRPGIILRNKFSIELNQISMVKSYFRIACRSLVKNKVFSLINILGLSVGLTAFILILLYVRFEFSYDNFHKNSQNIYRVATKETLQNEVINHESSTFEGIIQSLKTDFAEVKALTVISMFSSDNTFIRYQDRNKNIVPIENFKGCYADASFFSVFSFPLTQGSPTSVLKKPYSAVVSETFASKYFSTDALGKILEFKDDDKSKQFIITGVMKDFPVNSHLKADILINLPGDREPAFWDWGGHVYMLLTENAIPGEITRKLDRLAQINNGLKINKDDYGQVSTFELQSLTDIHLFSHLDYEFEDGGNGVLVYTLLTLAIVILMIAWVNYMNLSTAISAQKVTEIGIRKVVGASKAGLALQVFTESAVFNVLAVFIAIFLAWLLLPRFGDLVGVPLNFINLSDMRIGTAFFGFIVLSAILSGSYPAIVICSFQPLAALKGRSGTGGNFIVRKALVVFQFTAALMLMIISTVAYKQLAFMQHQDLGINIDQVVVIKALNFDKEEWSDAAGGYVVDSTYRRKVKLFKERLRDHSVITHATSLSHLPGQPPVWGTEFKVQDTDPQKAFSLKAIGIDYDFLRTFQVSLLAGRNFSPDFPADQGNEYKRAVLLNETASRLLGFQSPDQAIGHHLSAFWGADYEIIGVIKAFHQRSLKENLEPLYFVFQPRALSYYAVSFKSGEVTEALEQIRVSWSHFFPDYPFDYFFLNDYFNHQYQNDKMFGNVVGMFTVLAVFIGCMGLFGLTSYSVAQRTKEIGIRKVLGASVVNVIGLFTGHFVKLIFLANAIALPLVYLIITRWLDNYAYRISLVWWLFAVPLILILGIALLTVSLQTIKVALRNPVDSLKYE